MKENKRDRSFAVAVGVVILILAALLFVIFALPRISAVAKLNKVLAGLESAKSSDAIEVIDPQYEGGLIPVGVSAVIYAEDAVELSKSVTDIARAARYTEKRTSVGSLDISLSLRTEDGVFTVYFNEDELYVTKDDVQYVFTPNAKMVQSYSDFYKRLENIIYQSANGT